MPVEASVTVIVLNWNGKVLLEDCLGTLEKVEYNNYNVLVVDNGSTDDSVQYIKSNFSAVDVLELDNNLGYAGGNNAGFEHVLLKYDPEIVVFLNNDTIVDAHFISELVKKLDDPDAGISAPKIYYAHESERIWFNGADINLATGKIEHRNIREMDSARLVTMEMSDYATGCCLAIKSKIFSNINGFDEAFSMYAEDVDLSLRVKENGKEIFMAPGAKVWHKVSSSIGGEFSLKKLRRKFGGLLRIYVKHANLFEWLSILLLSPVLILVNLLRLLVLKFHQSSSE